LKKGGISSIIGPNGAAKTTLFNLLRGHLRPDSGAVFFKGVEITGMKKGQRGPWTPERVYGMFPILEKRQSQMGRTLSGGEQQMPTIARTLMGNPRLLLLDEPSEGLSPLIVRELELQVGSLKKDGMPILLSEQNSAFTLKLSDRSYILEEGQVKWERQVKELQRKPEILKKYLGV
jgi:branched-chain amino acid transport system ATP-binding protein